MGTKANIRSAAALVRTLLHIFFLGLYVIIADTSHMQEHNKI